MLDVMYCILSHCIVLYLCTLWLLIVGRREWSEFGKSGKLSSLGRWNRKWVGNSPS